jgi:hypothetical protein
MSTRIINHGIPAPQTGGGILWIDSCPVDAAVIWPVTGGKNRKIQAKAVWPQSLEMVIAKQNAATPTLVKTLGQGATIQVDAFTGENIPPDPGHDFTIYQCPDCGGFTDTHPIHVAVKQGQVGEIEEPSIWDKNTWCGKFLREHKAEILLTDESGKRGLRCGAAVRIESDTVKVIFSSQTGTTFQIEGDDTIYTPDSVLLWEKLKFKVTIDYYIKSACDIGNSFQERNLVNLQDEVEIETKICRSQVSMLKQVYNNVKGQWKAFSAFLYTSRTQMGDCVYGWADNLGPSVSNYCWALNSQNFSWSEPGPMAWDYYLLNEAGMAAEFGKHETEFWSRVTNFTKRELPWQKYPLFGPIQLGLTKRENVLELQILGDYPALRWEDPFVNRILKVAGSAGVTIESDVTL